MKMLSHNNYYFHGFGCLAFAPRTILDSFPHFAYGLNCFCCKASLRRLSASTRFDSTIACCSNVSTSGRVLCAAVDATLGRCLSGAQSIGSRIEHLGFAKLNCEQVPGLQEVTFICIGIGDSTWLWFIPARRWNSSSNSEESPPLVRRRAW